MKMEPIANRIVGILGALPLVTLMSGCYESGPGWWGGGNQGYYGNSDYYGNPGYGRNAYYSSNIYRGYGSYPQPGLFGGYAPGRETWDDSDRGRDQL
jgi:hypothetical protein